MFRHLMHKIIDVERLAHSVKTVIAVLIGLLLGKLLGGRTDQWIIITIIVVMCTQIYVGSVLEKAYLRLLGTITGCLFAAIAIALAGDTPVAVATAVGVSAFIFSFLAAKNEDLSTAGTLGAVTTAIIMLGQTPTILFAVERVLEIIAGIVIATLVSQFIFPIHARAHLRRAQAETLEKLQDYYRVLMSAHTQQTPGVDFHALDENIAKSLLKQRRLAKNSKHERLGLAFSYADFMETLFCEREMLRAITMMEIALVSVCKTNPQFLLCPRCMHSMKWCSNL